MPQIWHKKTYKGKLDYHWHLLTSHVSHMALYIFGLSMSLKIYTGQLTFLMSTHIHLIFMYPCMNLHVSTCWSIKEAGGQQTTQIDIASYSEYETVELKFKYTRMDLLYINCKRNFENYAFLPNLQLLLSFSNCTHAGPFKRIHLSVLVPFPKVWKPFKWSFIANERQIDFLISSNLKNKAYYA